MQVRFSVKKIRETTKFHTCPVSRRYSSFTSLAIKMTEERGQHKINIIPSNNRADNE